MLLKCQTLNKCLHGTTGRKVYTQTKKQHLSTRIRNTANKQPNCTNPAATQHKCQSNNFIS